MQFMRYGAFVLCLLVVALLSAGCITPTTTEQSGSSLLGKAAPTPTPTPGYGSVVISSDPWGATVYLDGEEKGTAPLTLTDVPAGKHTLLVTMLGYLDSNSTITVTADKTTTAKKSLKKGKPDIYLGIADTKMLQQGALMEVSGEVQNRGEMTAYDFKLIIEMTPKDSNQKSKKATKTITMGALAPGAPRHYVGHVELERYLDYSGTIKCEYTFDGKLVKGSTKAF